MHRDGLDIARLGTKVEGALDLAVEPDAVRDAAVARVVDRPIEIAGTVDGEPGGFGNPRVLDGEGDRVLGSGDRRNERKEHDGHQQQPEAARRAHQCHPARSFSAILAAMGCATGFYRNQFQAAATTTIRIRPPSTPETMSRRTRGFMGPG